MTVKIFSAGDWDNLPVEQNQIKVASVGMGPNDKHDAKKFASEEMLHWLGKMPLRDDCVYVHKIAMGGSHRFGPNRWGDGFREEVLDRDHHTFETDAKAYRQHKSDGDFYGHVKIARMRPGAGFVELVTEYFATPKVASLFDGKVADEEIQCLQKHGYIPVSMGSMVPGETCAVCGHFAKTPKDRCMSKKEGGNCELFGCKTGMLRVAEDGRMNYADNFMNRFYDISKVGVGADPVANGILLPLGQMYDKVQSVAKVAAFAESVAPELPPLSELELQTIKLAKFWADLEERGILEPDLEAGYATWKYSEPLTKLAGVHSRDTTQYRDAVKRLVVARQLPDFDAYAKSAGLTDAEIAAAKPFVPRAYTHLISQRQLLPTVKRARIFEISGQKPNDVFANASVVGVDSREVLRRSLLANANSEQHQLQKTASLHESVPDIVAGYAAFKLAYVTARGTADPQVLYGVVRRDHY